MLRGIEIEPNTNSVGSDLAKQEAQLLHLKGAHRIEKNQPHFRAAMFKFKAGLAHPGKGSVFQIREIYYFKFKKISEPMPKVLKQIDDALDNPVVKFVVDKATELALKRVMTALGPIGVVAQHMVSWMIPRGADYCFEVKDYRDQHALYRYTGVEHKDSLGLSELLGFFGKLSGVLKALSYAAKGAEGAQKAIDALGKLTQELEAKIDGFVRSHVGAEQADTIKAFLKQLREGTFLDQFAMPASDWNPFKFYDGGPKHEVAQLVGPARRNAVEAGMHAAIDVEFAGYVPNNWKDYNAEARYTTPFSFRNGLFGMGTSYGAFLLLRGPYFGDLAVSGLGKPVTD
jgi:hypothetical protein